ncbi:MULTISPECIES: universal stress protein [Nocardioides]|uniref:Universal stress protein n=1 Tax=Nocardioides vastitatis TaxID=2568655 RepID=A0ABW0ZIM4_9ACTN|nr:universal stress protein [Nocardioides sp.]THJ06225.1 hypothetical protein E7Z54_06305 [Nocardioides sp.]
MSTTRVRPVMACVATGNRPDAGLVFATDLALRMGKPLRLVHVDREGRPAVGDQILTPDLAELEAAVRYAASVGAIRPESAPRQALETERVQWTGAVRDGLVRLADGACVVVVMRRSLSRPRRLLAGSLSTHLAARASVPVVVVPEFWAPWHRTVPRITIVRGAGADVDAADDAELRSLLPDGVVEEVHIRSRHRLDDLVELSRFADLLVIARAPAGGLAPVARELLRRAHCPVATCRRSHHLARMGSRPSQVGT